MRKGTRVQQLAGDRPEREVDGCGERHSVEQVPRIHPSSFEVIPMSGDSTQAFMEPYLYLYMLSTMLGTASWGSKKEQDTDSVCKELAD